MAQKVVVYGHSDDCIEIDGEGLTDEFYASDDPKYVRFGDGTVLKVQYSPEGYSGQWKVERVKKGKAKYAHEPATDDDNYTDRVTLTGDLLWVECWNNPEPSAEELREKLAELDWSDVADEAVQAVWAAVRGR